MDIFDDKSAKPMLIAELLEPFDSPDYIYELKLDGERCLAYLDKSETMLQNKRSFVLNARFPELTAIHMAVKQNCILDGEVAILVDGKPNFSKVQGRSLMTNKFKIEMAQNKYPASFTAFDILYYKDKQVTDLPLMERRALLQKAVKENERIAISRYIEAQGKALYEAAEKQELEGVVAKRKDSKYYMGKRTKDWIKFKRLLDDDFVVCGYIPKKEGTTSIIIGQYKDGQLIYKGHVALGVSSKDFKKILNHQRSECPFPTMPKGNEDAKWTAPDLVCIVQWMPRENGALNQSVFKGLRDDKMPKECVVEN
jgi:bifunctional non-homologous end joining protein LigD